MNLEIEVPGLRIKLEFADKKQIDRMLLAVIEHAKGGEFKHVYDVSQTYTKRETPSKTKGYIEHEGVRTYADGYKLYKCSYSCQCKNKGVRYIQENDEYCKCHKCETKLTTSASTPNELHDEEFNYFIAY